MIARLQKGMLFASFSDQEIADCLACSGAEVLTVEKGEFIFSQSDLPRDLFVLLSGSIAICTNLSSGQRAVVAAIDQPGEMFGEVYLFLRKLEYAHYAEAVAESKVLRIPGSFFLHTCGKNCGYHQKLIANMLSVLAQKAFYLNQKAQVLSCATLRQKIALFLLQNRAGTDRVVIRMNREKFADFLNAARPSLSRELMNMQNDGLIAVNRNEIIITNLDRLEKIL